MSNYSKTVNFGAKDALSTGNPAKVIKGGEINTEFDNIATAIATKEDTGTTTSATGTLTGVTGTVTGTIYFQKRGSVVTMRIPGLSGTSNSTGFTLTVSFPSGYEPTLSNSFIARMVDNGVSTLGMLEIGGGTPGVITMYSNLNGAGWTGSGTKAIQDNINLTYYVV